MYSRHYPSFHIPRFHQSSPQNPQAIYSSENIFLRDIDIPVELLPYPSYNTVENNSHPVSFISPLGLNYHYPPSVIKGIESYAVPYNQYTSDFKFEHAPKFLISVFQSLSILYSQDRFQSAYTIGPLLNSLTNRQPCYDKTPDILISNILP
jgi:hypothetical protein